MFLVLTCAWYVVWGNACFFRVGRGLKLREKIFWEANIPKKIQGIEQCKGHGYNDIMIFFVTKN